ncbi:hypothetical protein F183_A52510 [Bryobacterales bacterium F-183]|nr:hypothetical protein F183_A52510 [Bryobacterales bacterium F-183]
MKAIAAITACLFIGAGLAHAQAAPDFDKELKIVLEKNCLHCHDAAKPAGGLRMDDREGMLKGGSKGPSLVPGKPDDSLMMKLIELPAGTALAMPPGLQMHKGERDIVRRWIAAGAPWPDNRKIGPGATAAARAMSPIDVAKAIHARIKAPEPKPYKQVIPGYDASYEMVPIPAGEFTMGTPASEKGRSDDEGPQRKVKVDAFLMQKHEVTWDEYRLFMLSQQSERGKDTVVDAVSRPTRPYVEMSFGMGINGYPAISMTQHAANKYAQWLSARTGHFYRLPTEAEWEYACRAGTTTPYSFGAEGSALPDYAWYDKNSNGKYEKVGTKKPNPWGLHDMHGNVGEWVLDEYAAYQPATGVLSNPWAKAKNPYPHTVRGGSWNDPPDRLRCGARLGSDPSWKMQDPQLPKSIWYLTDAQWLGFRLVRPLKVPTPEEMDKYWNSGVENEQ